MTSEPMEAMSIEELAKDLHVSVSTVYMLDQRAGVLGANTLACEALDGIGTGKDHGHE